MTLLSQSHIESQLKNFLVNPNLSHENLQTLESYFTLNPQDQDPMKSTKTIAVNFFGKLASNPETKKKLEGFTQKLGNLANSELEGDQKRVAQSVYAHVFYVESEFLFSGLADLPESQYQEIINDQNKELYSEIILDLHTSLENNDNQSQFWEEKPNRSPKQFELFSKRIEELKSIQTNERAISPVCESKSSFDSVPQKPESKTKVNDLPNEKKLQKIGLLGNHHNAQKGLQSAIGQELREKLKNK